MKLLLSDCVKNVARLYTGGNAEFLALLNDAEDMAKLLIEQDEKQKQRNEQYFILSFFDALKIEANRASYCKSIYEYAVILCLSRFLVWIETDVDTYYRMAKELFDFSNLLVVTEVNKGGQNDTNKECGTLV